MINASCHKFLSNSVIIPYRLKFLIFQAFLYALLAIMCFTRLSVGFVIKERTLSDNTIDFGGPFQEVDLQAIPISSFHEKMKTSRNYRDIFRLFLVDPNLPDHIIDELVTARSYNDFSPKFGKSEISNDIEGPRNPDDAFQHLKEMMTLSTCVTAHPHCINIREYAQTPTVYYEPKCTIVHRCSDETGCCDDGYRCSSVQTERITRQFFALNYVGKGRGSNSVLLPENFFETFTFENHTKCGCTRIKETVGRCVKCPFPYILTKGPPLCDCDCHRDDSYCRRVKQGQIIFREEALTCIKSEECHRPVCEFGDFNMDTLKIGKCPSMIQMERSIPNYSGNSVNEIHFKDYDAEDDKKSFNSELGYFSDASISDFSRPTEEKAKPYMSTKPRKRTNDSAPKQQQTTSSTTSSITSSITSSTTSSAKRSISRKAPQIESVKFQIFREVEIVKKGKIKIAPPWG